MRLGVRVTGRARVRLRLRVLRVRSSDRLPAGSSSAPFSARRAAEGR